MLDRRGLQRVVAMRRRRRVGFSLIEALVALTLLAVAGAVMLQATDATLVTVDYQYETMAAQGVARQLMEEICSRRFHELGTDPYGVAPGPTNWESAGDGRSRFDDVDDYANYKTRPVLDLWGQPLGSEDGEGGLRAAAYRAPRTYLDRWRVRVRIGYTDSPEKTPDWSGSQAGPYRVIRITIHRIQDDGSRFRLARLQRVITYTEMEQW